MSGSRVQSPVPGSKTLALLTPTSSPLWPPTTTSRPSGSWAVPAQNIGWNRLGAPVKDWVVGFQRRAEGVWLYSQTCQTSTSPVRSSAMLTATTGQLIVGPHCPTAAAPLGVPVGLAGAAVALAVAVRVAVAVGVGVAVPPETGVAVGDAVPVAVRVAVGVAVAVPVAVAVAVLVGGGVVAVAVLVGGGVLVAV